MFNIRKEIIRAFKRGIFPYIDGFKVDEESDEKLDEESDENKFLKILRIYQKVLTMNCLKNILILLHLVLLQNNYLKQKIKKKSICKFN